MTAMSSLVRTQIRFACKSCKPDCRRFCSKDSLHVIEEDVPEQRCYPDRVWKGRTCPTVRNIVASEDGNMNRIRVRRYQKPWEKCKGDETERTCHHRNEGDGSAALVDNVYANTLLTRREGRGTEEKHSGFNPVSGFVLCKRSSIVPKRV